MSLQPATPLCISPAAWTPVSISEEGTPSSTPSPVPSPSYSRASSPTLTPDGPSPRAGFHVDEREEGEVDEEEEEEEESDYGESTAEFGSGRVIKDHRYGDPPIAKGKENERRSSVLLYSNAKHASIGQAPRTNIGRVSSSSNAHSSTDPHNLQPDDDTDDETDSEVEFDGDPGVGSQWLRGEVEEEWTSSTRTIQNITAAAKIALWFSFNCHGSRRQTERRRDCHQAYQQTRSIQPHDHRQPSKRSS
jgi:hypothetical protein